MRFKLFGEELCVAELASRKLKRQRDQVAEPSARKHILARKESVIRVHAERCASGHRAGQDREPESSRISCGDRVREENQRCAPLPERDRSIAGSRPSDLHVSRIARASACHDRRQGRSPTADTCRSRAEDRSPLHDAPEGEQAAADRPVQRTPRSGTSHSGPLACRTHRLSTHFCSAAHSLIDLRLVLPATAKTSSRPRKRSWNRLTFEAGDSSPPWMGCASAVARQPAQLV